MSADGQAVSERARSLSPDLVVLDIGIPEMDGLTVCREIRKTSEVLILFLIAQSYEVGLEVGADDYVAKPFSPACGRL